MANVVDRVRAAGYAGKEKTMELVDSQLPPERRSELARRVQNWASANPKLAAFVLAQVTLSSIPILVFLIFSTTILLSALGACLFIGFLVAITFTGLCIGASLFILVPTLVVTSVTALFVYIWGLIGYLIIRRYNDGKVSIPSVQTIKKRANQISDGRLELLTASPDERARAVEAAREVRTTSESQDGQGAHRTNGGGDWNQRWTNAQAYTQPEDPARNASDANPALGSKTPSHLKPVEGNGITLNQLAAQVGKDEY